MVFDVEISDWFLYFWQPFWFAWDLVGTLGILLLVRRWVKGSVTDTKDQVVEELKKPETAKAVKGAMDIPDRADITKLTERIERKDFEYQTMLDSRMTGLYADIKAMIKETAPDLKGLEGRLDLAVRAAVAPVEAKIVQMKIDPESLAADMKKAMTDSGKAMLSREAKAANQQQEAIMAAYQRSAQAQYDHKYITSMLLGMKVPPGMADLAATYGPTGVEWALRMTFGDKRTAELIGGIQEAKAALMPMIPPTRPGGYA